MIHGRIAHQSPVVGERRVRRAAVRRPALGTSGLGRGRQDRQALVSTVVGIARHSVLFVLFAAASFWIGLRRRHLLDDQTTLESLRNTLGNGLSSWWPRAFRRQGYRVDYSLGAVRWWGGLGAAPRRTRDTGAMQTVEGLFRGCASRARNVRPVTAERADEVIVVTSGKLHRWSAGRLPPANPSSLWTACNSLALIRSVQTGRKHQPPPTTHGLPLPPSRRARFVKPMVLRIARRSLTPAANFGAAPYPAFP